MEILGSPGVRRRFRIKALIPSPRITFEEILMDKKISVASYWLGIVCVVTTIILRGIAAVGCCPNLVPENEAGITGVTFEPAAAVFLLQSIAAGLMSRRQREKS